MTINGILECPLLDVGSKSEGRRAILTDSEGNTYKLYRPEVHPVDDEYFYRFIGMQITVTGKHEPRTGNFLVESITQQENTEEAIEETTSEEHTEEPISEENN